MQARCIPNGWEESPRGRWVAVAVSKAPSSWSVTEWVQVFAEEAWVGCRQRFRRKSRLRESDACRRNRESGVSPDLDQRESLGNTKRRAAADPSDVEKT